MRSGWQERRASQRSVLVVLPLGIGQLTSSCVLFGFHFAHRAHCLDFGTSAHPLRVARALINLAATYAASRRSRRQRPSRNGGWGRLETRAPPPCSARPRRRGKSVGTPLRRAAAATMQACGGWLIRTVRDDHFLAPARGWRVRRREGAGRHAVASPATHLAVEGEWKERSPLGPRGAASSGVGTAHRRAAKRWESPSKCGRSHPCPCKVVLPGTEGTLAAHTLAQPPWRPSAGTGGGGRSVRPFSWAVPRHARATSIQPPPLA